MPRTCTLSAVYSVAVSRAVDDQPTTVVVIPEVVTSLAWNFPLSRKAIWWLSIDNYFKWQHCNPGRSILERRADLIHLCQSHYALDFLTSRQIGPLLMVTDFSLRTCSLPVPRLSG